MKITKTACVFLIVLFYQNLSFSQIISRKVADTYPPSIVRRLFETVISKVPLTEPTQMWLARAYSQQDSLITAILYKRGISKKEIDKVVDSTTMAIEIGLKNVMTSIEKNDFKYNIEDQRPYGLPIYKGKIISMAEMNSQFGLAYKMKNEIHLTDQQSLKILNAAVELRRKIEFYNLHPDSGYFDRAAFESVELAKILTDKQINPVLASKNKKSCQLQAKYDWHELTKLSLASKFNKDTTYNRITVYYMIKAHINDRFAGEQEKRALLLKGVMMPEALIALQKAKQGNSAKLNKYAW